MLYAIPILFLIIYNLPTSDKKVSVFLSVVPILLLTAFRYGYGADYFSYKTIYVGMELMDFKELFGYYTNIDFGFKQLMFISNGIGLPYHLFNVVISVLTICLFTAWINDITETHKQFTLGMFLFYSLFIFVWSWSAMRQGVVLSIGTYLFLNPKFNISRLNKLVIICILSFLHTSALFYLLLLIDVRLNKKQLLLFVMSGIFFSLLPLGVILQHFNNLPIISSFVAYLDLSKISILSFASLTRLALFAGTLYFYDELNEEMNSSDLLQIFIIGFGLYFYTSLSPVAAGRLHAFSYILIIPILITLWSLDSTKKGFSILIKSGICFFALLYLYKETNTMAYQSGLTGYSKLVPYVNVFNNKNHVFDNEYLFSSNMIEESLNEYFSFEENNNYSISEPKLDDKFVTVKSNRNDHYGIINQEGAVIVDFSYHLPINIYGHFYERITTINNITRAEYVDIFTGQIVDLEVILEEIVRIKDLSNVEILSDLAGLVDVDNQVRSLFVFPDKVGLLYINYLHKPYDYNILSFSYYHRNYMIYLDDKMKPIIDKIFLPSSVIDIQGFIVGITPKTNEIYNSSGELVWIEKR